MGNLSTALLGFRFSCTRIICFGRNLFFWSGGRKENPGIYEKDQSDQWEENLFYLIKLHKYNSNDYNHNRRRKPAARLLQRKS
jgi:hypothetical protein